MRIEIDNNALLILPETPFEEDYISKTFGIGNLKCFVKRGFTSSEIIGIKICTDIASDPEVFFPCDNTECNDLDCGICNRPKGTCSSRKTDPDIKIIPDML